MFGTKSGKEALDGTGWSFPEVWVVTGEITHEGSPSTQRPQLLQALPKPQMVRDRRVCRGSVIITCYHAFPRHLLLVSVRDRTVGDWDMRVTRHSGPVPFL